MHEELAMVSVVVPVGPRDAVAPRLHAQLVRTPIYVLEVQADARPDEATPLRADDRADDHAHDTAPAQTRWTTLRAPRGRAVQQNSGAHAAAGDWLWFLHADALLAEGTLTALARFIAGRHDALGYFDLRFLDDGPALMPLNTIGAWCRSRLCGLPFGDQGLVLHRDTFARLGGFDARLDCGEDHELVWRARRAGVPVRAIGAPLYTSARRYAQRGWWRTTCEHQHETWRQAWRFGAARSEPRRGVPP